MSRPPVRAIVWDFDNTLVDTRARNRSVTRRIIESLTGRDADEYPALRTQDAYDRATHRTQNWQDLYRVHFGLDADAVRAAGGLWTGLQLDDPTPTTWFGGIPAVVRDLQTWPQAIVSMNTSANILAALETAGLASAFDLVIGCEEVRYRRQKPEPDGLIRCLEALTGMTSGTVFYVGDHPVDSECAANANRALRERGAGLRVVSIGAAYGTVTDPASWDTEPEHRARDPHDVLAIVRAVAAAGIEAGAPLPRPDEMDNL